MSDIIGRRASQCFIIIKLSFITSLSEKTLAQQRVTRDSSHNKSLAK